MQMANDKVEGKRIIHITVKCCYRLLI